MIPTIIDLVTFKKTEPESVEPVHNVEVTVDVPIQSALLGLAVCDTTIHLALLVEPDGPTEKRKFILIEAQLSMPPNLGTINPLGVVTCMGRVWFVFVEVPRVVRGTTQSGAQAVPVDPRLQAMIDAHKKATSR